MFRQHYEKMYNLARSILSDDDESKDKQKKIKKTMSNNNIQKVSIRFFNDREVRAVWDECGMGSAISQLVSESFFA